MHPVILICIYLMADNIVLLLCNIFSLFPLGCVARFLFCLAISGFITKWCPITKNGCANWNFYCVLSAAENLI